MRPAGNLAEVGGMLRRMAVQVKVKLCVATIGKFNRRRDLRESTKLKFDEGADGWRR